MTKSTFSLSFIIIVFLLQVCTADDRLFQYRFDVAVSKKINDQWKGIVSGETRFIDGSHDLFYRSGDIGLNYSGLANWINLGFHLKIGQFDTSALKIGDGDVDIMVQEIRPHFNVTLHGQPGGIPLQNRTRLEYRDFENIHDEWRARNKFTIKAPLKLTAAQCQPYLADEFFYYFNDRRFYQHRTTLGIGFRFSPNIKGNLYHFWQQWRSNSEILCLRVLGFKLDFAF